MGNKKDREPPYKEWCIVECDELCRSGLHIAMFNHDKKQWEDEHGQDITQYVTNWQMVPIFRD